MMTNLMLSRAFGRSFAHSQYRALPVASGLCALMLLACGFVPAHAQSVSSFGFQTTIPFVAGGVTPGPAGVALDASGDLFVSDNTSNDRVIEVPVGCASTSCETVVASSLNNPAGLAVDSSGDLFIANYGGNDVIKIPSGCANSGCWVVLSGSLSTPTGVAVDASGDLFIASFGSNVVVEVPAGCATTSCWTTAGSGLNDPFGVAVDGAGNLYIADYFIGDVVKVPPGCTMTSCQTVIAAAISNPTSVAIDGSNNVFITVYGSNEVLEVPSGCATSSCWVTAGNGLKTPFGVAADALGDLFIGDYGNNRLLRARQSSFNLETVSVGGTSAAATAYFNFGASVTLGSTPFQLLTLGKSGSDFADAGGEGLSGCTATSYSSGNSCIVNVQLAPSAPGLRFGALQLEDSSGNPIVTANVYGTGTGPQIFFPDSSSLTPNIVGSGFFDPEGVAVDGSGDVFVADSGNNGVKEIVAVGGQVSSGSTVNPVGGSGYHAPTGVAVDGSGDVFVADYLNGAVKEIVAVGGQVSFASTVNTVGSGFSAPTGVAVDGSGDVFVADFGSGINKVYEIVAANGQVTSASTVNTVGSGFKTPVDVKVDSNGDVFVADEGNDAVKEIVAVNGQVSSSSTVITVGSGFIQPFGVTVDAAGDVFVADYGNNAVKEIVAVGGQVSSSSAVVTLGWGFVTPTGVALDPSGDVFVADYGNNEMKEMPLATPPSITFQTVTEQGTSDTTDGPQTATVANDGNATLTFNLPSSGDNPGLLAGTNFTWDASSTCTQTTSGSSTAFTLAEGASCLVAVDFAPTASGALTDTLLLTDNTLNAASATQQLPVSGTGATPAIITIPSNGSTLTSASTTFNWTASPGSGGVTGYYLWIGTSPGASDLANIGLSGTTATVTLPTTGATIYVELWTVINGTPSVPTSYTYKEDTYTAAAITIPSNTSTLTSASTTFNWTASPGAGGVTGYYLHIGTTSGASNLANIGPISGTTATVTLPTNGATIFVTLYTDISGGTQLSNNFTYTEYTVSAAAITIPSNTSTLTSASTTFNWTASPGAGGVTGYYLWIGTSVGASNLANMSVSGTTATVTLPTTGATIYVELWTKFSSGALLSNSYTYTEFTVSAAAITIPANTSTLTSASTTFNWTASPGAGGVTGYYLWIGTSSGASNLVNIGPLSSSTTTATVTLPTNGATIYVELWTKFSSGALLSNSYTYTEDTYTAAAITIPSNTSTLTSASTTFNWTASPGAGGVTGYYLHIGTTSGASNLANIGPLSSSTTTATVTLPTTGATIFVTLYTDLSGGTQLSNSYTYTEDTYTAAAITIPSNTSTLTSASTTFNWTASPGAGGVTGYYLHIGTTSGASNLANIGPLSSSTTTATVTLPTNGATIFVTLYTDISGGTQLSNSYTYTEFTMTAGAITIPTNGSQLTSASTTFNWTASPGVGGVTGYYLWIGTTPGTANLVNIGPLSGTTATVTLPTNGATIYVELWTKFSDGDLLSNSYTYTEFN